VRSVGALQNGTQLRVTHARLLARRAHTPGPDANLDEVGAGQDQFLDHLPRDDVARDERLTRVRLARLAHVVDKVFAVAVGHVEADERAVDHVHDRGDLGVVRVRRARRHRDVGQDGGVGVPPGLPFFHRVVLVDAGEKLLFRKRFGDLKGTDRVHVGGHDGHPGPLQLRVLEIVRPVQADL